MLNCIFRGRTSCGAGNTISACFGTGRFNAIVTKAEYNPPYVPDIPVRGSAESGGQTVGQRARSSAAAAFFRMRRGRWRAAARR